MSRPANPYDNASCESFMKTLKREEIYANRYDNLEHLRANIEEFIEQYYNRQRLHSALGYRSPEEFERESRTFWAGGEHRECKSCVFQTMTKKDDKFSWRGGDVAPSPRSPGLSQRPRRKFKICRCAQEKPLTEGVQSAKLGTTWEQLLPNTGKNRLTREC